MKFLKNFKKVVKTWLRESREQLKGTPQKLKDFWEVEPNFYPFMSAEIAPFGGVRKKSKKKSKPSKSAVKKKSTKKSKAKKKIKRSRR